MNESLVNCEVDKVIGQEEPNDDLKRFERVGIAIKLFSSEIQPNNIGRSLQTYTTSPLRGLGVGANSPKP
jgi:hypothetical protein